MKKAYAKLYNNMIMFENIIKFADKFKLIINFDALFATNTSKINEKYQNNPEEINIGEYLSAIFKIQKTFGMWFTKIFQYLVFVFVRLIRS